MMRLTTTLLITVSLISQIALAGLPPTTTKSQLDSAKSTTFDFQAPFNQITKPSGTTALIETGNKNLLKDPGFESSDPTAIWTLSSAGVFTRTGTAANVGSGSYAASYDGAAAGGMVASTAITIPNGWGGKNLEISCDIKNASAGTHTIQLYDGSNVLQSATILTGSGYLANVMNYPAPSSGTVQLRIVSTAANEPDIFFDDCYLGLARNVGSTQLISEWTSYTPTIGFTGGSTTAYGKYRQNGTNVEVEFDATFTTVFTGGTGTVSLPAACGAIDTTQVPTGFATGVGIPNSNVRLYDVGSGQWGGSIVYNDTTTVLMRTWTDDVGAGGNHVQVDAAITTTIPFTWVNNDRVNGRFTVPCTGFKAQTTASIDAISKRGSIYFASGSATNTGSVAAFNVAGFGTNTLEGQALAPTTANDLGIRMTGAPAATYEVQATGLFYAETQATTGTRTVCQYSLYDGTNSRGHAYAITGAAGSAAFSDGIGSLTGTFVLSSAGTINVVVRGQRVTGNGTCYAEGPVSISIKNVSQPSPAIVLANSVSSASTNGTHFNSSQVGSTGTVSKETGDWVSGSCSVASAVFTCTLVAGAFSTDPACHATIFGETTSYNAVVTSASTSSVVVRTFDTANVAAAAAFALTCSSPR